MGRRTGLPFEYVKMSFDEPPTLLHFQTYARQLIAEVGVSYKLPPRAFFCSNYLDSQLSYFDPDREETDPLLFDLEVGNPRQPTSDRTLCEYISFILRVET